MLLLHVLCFALWGARVLGDSVTSVSVLRRGCGWIQHPNDQPYRSHQKVNARSLFICFPTNHIDDDTNEVDQSKWSLLHQSTTPSNDVPNRSFRLVIQSFLRTKLLAMTIVISMVLLNLPSSYTAALAMPNMNEAKTSMIANKETSHTPFSYSITMMLMMTNPFQQFETVGMIPKSFFDRHISIYGYTERIIDGDTFRVRHIPACAMLLPTSRAKELSAASTTKGRRGGIADSTLLVRLYGIDCPEVGKNKNQVTQPFGNDAKEFTSRMIAHQVVKITLLRKDQYGRAVAMVETVPPNILTSSKDLSIELARQGYAELYTGGGFEYNVRIFHSP